VSQSVPESDKQYTAYLCSRIPNNECDLCSHYLPEYIRETQPVRHEWAFGYHGIDRCPSCRRSVIRLFLSAEMPRPKRTPADIPLRFPDDVFSGFHEGEKAIRTSTKDRLEFVIKTKPIHMREDLNWQERNRKLIEYVESRDSGNSKRAGTTSYEEPNVIPADRGKEIKRTVRFS
jgi:hypothetical protein